MRTFRVSDKVRVDAIVGDTRPYIVIHQGVAPGMSPLYIVIGLADIKSLIAQLVEATIHLLEEAYG